MLATDCAVCGKALRDALSVDLGIGPDCRKKYGYNVEIDPEARKTANKIIHAIACERSADAPNRRGIIDMIEQVRALGLADLATILAQRLSTVEISTRPDGRIGVDVAYSEETVAALRAVPGRYWDRDAKLTTYPAQREVKNALWATLRRLFPGAIVRLPGGNLTLAE
jgi:hypothetical protein